LVWFWRVEMIEDRRGYARSVVGLAGLILVCAAPLITRVVSARAVGGDSQSATTRPGAEAAPWVKPAVDGVLDLFKQKSVVALGDEHGLAEEEAFYSALLRAPRFAEEVGNVVVEFGGEASQGIIDRYVAGEDVPLTELRRVWTETAGWIPGPTSLGYVNFFANVRAVNLKLPREHRIKVWLGDPKIDWSKINSLRDFAPYLGQRDDHFFRIISDEILKKHEKALLIIGGAHLLGPGGRGPLSAKIEEAYPHTLAIVSPFVGYIEPGCNAKVVARAKNWPVPAVVGPVESTWLKSELQLAGCNYLPSVISFGPSSTKQKMSIGMAPPGPPPGKQSLGAAGAPGPVDINAENGMLSGVASDAILYLGPPDTLTQSPIDPNIYLDPEYFKEENRRAKCCTPFAAPLDWDQILRENSLIPKKFHAQPIPMNETP
jgi:hypothetical protein